MTERLHFHFSLSCIGEENGNPLQCSCLENPRFGGAWWAAVYGVTQSRTWLKWLRSSSSSRNAFRSMKPRNWNALHHTAKERSHTDSTMELAPKWKRKYLCQGPAPFHAALQLLSQGGCPVSSLRAATLWFSLSWWFLPGALDASCVIWTHWIQTVVVWKPLLLSPY